MFGFESVPNTEGLREIDEGLVKVNDYLKAYDAWNKEMDAWLVVQVEDPQWVYQWRLEAEQRMKASGKGGMTNEQVADFVSRYMPSYRAYLPGLYGKVWRSSTTGAELPVMKISIDASRSPI